MEYKKKAIYNFCKDIINTPDTINSYVNFHDALHGHMHDIYMICIYLFAGMLFRHWRISFVTV